MRYRKHDGVYFAYYDTKYETIVAYKSFSLSLSLCFYFTGSTGWFLEIPSLKDWAM